MVDGFRCESTGVEDCGHGEAASTETAEDDAAARAPAARSLEQFLGWCVHAYTALGLVAAGLIAVLAGARRSPTRSAGRSC